MFENETRLIKDKNEIVNYLKNNPDSFKRHGLCLLSLSIAEDIIELEKLVEDLKNNVEGINYYFLPENYLNSRNIFKYNYEIMEKIKNENMFAFVFTKSPHFLECLQTFYTSYNFNNDFMLYCGSFVDNNWLQLFYDDINLLYDEFYEIFNMLDYFRLHKLGNDYTPEKYDEDLFKYCSDNRAYPKI